MTEPELHMISVDLIDPHPDNPRPIDPDHVDTLAANMRAGGYDTSSPVLVRLLSDRFQLVAGHHRTDAARKAGLTAIPGDVREMTDDEAHRLLVTLNNQKEIDRVQRAINFYEHVERYGKGKVGAGAGNTGGIREAAREYGYVQQEAQRLYQIGEFIARNDTPGVISAGQRYRGMAKAILAVRDTPEAGGPALLAWVADKRPTEALAAKAAEDISRFVIPEEWVKWLPLETAVERYLEGRFSPDTVARLFAAAADVREWIAENGEEGQAEEFSRWLAVGPITDRRDIAAYKATLIAVKRDRDREAARAEAEKIRAAAATERERQNMTATQPGDDVFGFGEDADQLEAEADRLETEAAIAEVVAEAEEEAARKAYITLGWHHGRYQDHLDELEDGSVDLLLTDPPYGMKFVSNFRTVRHSPIEGDSGDPGEIIGEMISALLPKLAADAQVLVFCHPGRTFIDKVMDALTDAGLTVRDTPLVWAKGRPGMGSLDRDFAPSYETIVHASKGDPKLYQRPDNVLTYGLAGSDRHPTEKPTDLLTELIEATTAPGQLVADPFGGVASTAVAARDADRKWWSCEMDEDYWHAGEERLS